MQQQPKLKQKAPQVTDFSSLLSSFSLFTKPISGNAEILTAICIV
jgi:hypothetical protein